MKFRKVDDLLKDTELLNATASPDAHIVTGSEEKAALTASSQLCSHSPRHRGIAKMQPVDINLQRMEEPSSQKASRLGFRARRKRDG